MRTKYICFTHNNYADSDLLYYRQLVEEGRASYLVFGLEVGSSGTRHVQGYAELPNRLRLTGLRELLPGCHIESRRGTAQQASDYCKKGNEVFAFCFTI